MILSKLFRGAAWLPLFLCAASAAQAQGNQQFPEPPSTSWTWASGGPNSATSVIDVTYFIGAGFSAAQQTAIRNAANVWTSAKAGVRLVEVGTAGASGIDVLYNNQAFDLGSVNLVTGPLSVAPDGSQYRQISSGTINVDNSPLLGFATWGTGPVAGGQYDFTAVLINLFGQSLGLGLAGPGDPNSVMTSLTPIFGFGTGPQNQTLSAEDVAALASLYGAPEPATWTLFGAGLLAMGALRKRSRVRA